jgi:hypothetical protein
MRVVLVDPDLAGRAELVAMLEACGITVAPFADPRSAFLFLLARPEELDGVLVNDDDGEPSHWLRCRVEMLSAPLPVASYSGCHPQREARVYDRVQQIGFESRPAAGER